MKVFVTEGIGEVGVVENPIPEPRSTRLCRGGSERMSRLMRLIERGRVDPTTMTTHRFGFDQIERAFEMMRDKEDGIIKPLVSF